MTTIKLTKEDLKLLKIYFLGLEGSLMDDLQDLEFEGFEDEAKKLKKELQALKKITKHL